MMRQWAASGRTVVSVAALTVLAAAALPSQGAARQGPSMERSFTAGTPTVLESAGPRAPNKVVFEDDGETGYFYALDLSRPEDSQIVDAIGVYNVKTPRAGSKPQGIRLQWTADGGKVALFLNGRAEAVFDFDHKRGYARSGSPMPGISPWPRSNHSWDDEALAGIQ